MHYLAIPPTAFPEITKAIGTHGLAANSRVVYEKPYGTSSESFTELDDLVHTVFDEEQVYRIDHFLGKEATQNLHMLRFANRMIGDSWDREAVAEVQIDVPETLGIADRAGFYDATGAALDMLVTHLFQVAAEVALEPPAEADGLALQKARESVISAFRPLDPREVVLGQFEGYRQTDGVADDSTTDTFVAARLWVDTDRWRGVPFLLRTGKRLAASAQRVSLVFREPDGPVHPGAGCPTVLTFDLSGCGALDLQLVVKQPGPDFVPAEASTAIHLEHVHEGAMAPYTSLLHDVLDRGPVAVHQRARPGCRLPGLRPAAERRPAGCAALRAGQLGTGRGGHAPRPARMAAPDRRRREVGRTARRLRRTPSVPRARRSPGAGVRRPRGRSSTPAGRRRPGRHGRPGPAPLRTSEARAWTSSASADRLERPAARRPAPVKACAIAANQLVTRSVRVISSSFACGASTAAAPWSVHRSATASAVSRSPATPVSSDPTSAMVSRLRPRSARYSRKASSRRRAAAAAADRSPRPWSVRRRPGRCRSRRPSAGTPCTRA